MQIISVENAEFPKLLLAWREGKNVGRYWRDGKVQIVSATNQFVLIAYEDNPQKIALKPARGISEAEAIALQLLNREQSRGNRTELA